MVIIVIVFIAVALVVLALCALRAMLIERGQRASVESRLTRTTFGLAYPVARDRHNGWKR